MTAAEIQNETKRRCIENCLDFHEAAMQCLLHCPDRGGTPGEMGYVRLLLDCAEICHTCAGLMQRGTEQHIFMCRVCSKFCGGCADAFENIYTDNEYLRLCVAACRRCAESCHVMASIDGLEQSPG